MITIEEFKATLNNAHPPVNLSPSLKALWHDGKGDWESSHNIAQDIHSREGSWIHAYLHRKEGDIGNASYWYSKAGRSMPKISLQDEWQSIVQELLKA